MTTTTWIIAADSSRARIMQVMDRDQRLAEVEDFDNPDARLRDRDLVSDARPRSSGASAPASDGQEKSATEHATELFAKRVGDYLDKARVEHRFDRLHLVAAPKFLGQLRKELDPEVKKLVSEALPKDLSWLSLKELEARFVKGSGRAP